MSPDAKNPADQPTGEHRLADLPARPADKSETAAVKRPAGSPLSAAARDTDDDVIRIEDLTPRENVKGGRKVILGEVATRPEEPK